MVIYTCYVNLNGLNETRVYFIALDLLSVLLLLSKCEIVYMCDLTWLRALPDNLTVLSELIPHWSLIESSRQGLGRIDKGPWVHCSRVEC